MLNLHRVDGNENVRYEVQGVGVMFHYEYFGAKTTNNYKPFKLRITQNCLDWLVECNPNRVQTQCMSILVLGEYCLRSEEQNSNWWQSSSPNDLKRFIHCPGFLHYGGNSIHLIPNFSWILKKGNNAQCKTQQIELILILSYI